MQTITQTMTENMTKTMTENVDKATAQYTTMVDQMTRTWKSTLDGFYRVQEQNEKLLLEMVEHNRQMRTETRRMAEKMMEQATENQKTLSGVYETAGRAIMENLRVPQGR